MKRLALGFALFAPGVHANLITNGGFDTNLGGWTVVQPYACVSYSNVFTHDVPGGLFAMGCKPAATVKQTISGLTVGDNYQLSYWLKNSYGSGASAFSFTLGGEELKSLSLSAFSDWTRYTFDWTSNVVAAELAFSLGQTRNSSMWQLDTVSLVAAPSPVTTKIPEPATLALLGVGAIALGFAIRRRK